MGMGHELTYDWSVHGSVKLTSKERLQEVAAKELGAVLEADFVVVLLPGGYGTHVELGLALASGKEVILHSEDGAFFDPSEKTCAFYHYSRLTQLVCPFETLAKELEKVCSQSVLT